MQQPILHNFFYFLHLRKSFRFKNSKTVFVHKILLPQSTQKRSGLNINEFVVDIFHDKLIFSSLTLSGSGRPILVLTLNFRATRRLLKVYSKIKLKYVTSFFSDMKFSQLKNCVKTLIG